MSNVTLQDAKADLSNVVDRAAHGEIVRITRDGIAVAAIVPIEAADAARDAAARRKPGLVDHLMAFPGDDADLERNRSPSRDVDL
ncbi:type II toxin-antitoxin system prevent-host-death family antitoxin [Aurantimonas sp. 22II-16-19i]|uniref:type II toxin-antitoxin system Phd/YefM family antitoxin n=1 Tax=Aurantimonas sp. 22II-16-19i TaxID=1317114 RepID=UPI0009F7FD09|nr:type II toxin-antitoxin system prevent-host-death family antitoxin [Aurantimonas sp. 22II-16-19i]ORE98091.1 prevent-host-death family protein [Aurantimonas sp. 22II-16-19i]